MSSSPAWQRDRTIKMQERVFKLVKGRNGFISLCIVVLIFIVYNASAVLPAASLSSIPSSSNPATSSSASKTEDTIKISSCLSDSLDAAAASKEKAPSPNATTAHSAASKYFGQVFAKDPPEHDFLALKEHCAATLWPEDEVYLQCAGMSAGLTSIMSQLKVCFKMAVEAGTGLILPSMPLRDSTDLREFNLLNEDAHMPYDDWFDLEHFAAGMAKACPQMKILHPRDLKTELWPVKNRWNVDVNAAPGHIPYAGLFWTGNPFKTFFDAHLAALEELAYNNPDKDDSKKGITAVTIQPQFLILRITDDPTQRDLRLWNDLGLLIRIKEDARLIVEMILGHMGRPFYGVHFRVESDTIWSGIDHQLAVDLDALDTAWTRYGKPNEQKPLVYLACGDQGQIAKFVEAAALRGWDVVHKWAIAQPYPDVLEKINVLPFDFQGAVDLGIMIKSDFFLGITGSAFSSSIANVRDETGRYRGSSFLVGDDAGARTHLFNDGDARAYACCL